MPLSPGERAALRDSLATISANEGAVARAFYARLFREHPEAAGLFSRHSEPAQRRMFTDSLVAVVDHLDDSPWLRTYLSTLGQRHVSYEVTDPMYDWFVSRLLESLEEALGAEWTPEVARAWRHVLDDICDVMRAEHR